MERNYPWYKFSGEDVVIVTGSYTQGNFECDIEKFKGIKPIDEGEHASLLRIADIEAKGIEVNSKDVLLSYDDCYAGGWCGSCEIAEHYVKNCENEQYKIYEYVTEMYWELEQEEEQEEEQ